MIALTQSPLVSCHRAELLGEYAKARSNDSSTSAQSRSLSTFVNTFREAMDAITTVEGRDLSWGLEMLSVFAPERSVRGA